MDSNASVTISDISRFNERTQRDILVRIFGSECENLSTLLSTTSQLVGSDLHEYEFEVRIADLNDVSTSISYWNTFNERFDPITTISSFTDDLITSFIPVIPLRNIHFRSYSTTHTHERKILINKILARSDDRSLPTIVIKLSKETTMSPLPSTSPAPLSSLQRRIRISSTFNDPNLHNWRIDRTIRLFSSSPTDAKLTIPFDITTALSATNYDVLDIEFEYVGHLRDLIPSLFKLLEVIYADFDGFNTTYNVLSSIVNVFEPSITNLSSIPSTPVVLTSNVLTSMSIPDYTISPNVTDNTYVLIVFMDIRPNGITPTIYLVTSPSSVIILSGDDIMTTLSKRRVVDAIAHRIITYNMNERSIPIPSCSVFEVKQSTTSPLTFMITDVIVYNSSSIINSAYETRMIHATEFVSIMSDIHVTAPPHIVNDLGASTPDVHFIVIPTHDYSMSHEQFFALANTNTSPTTTFPFTVNGLTCRLSSAPFASAPVFYIKPSSIMTVDFLVCYDSILDEYLLYVTGNVNTIIKTQSFSNNMSIQHFGLSLIDERVHNSSGQLVPITSIDVPILHVSPYMKNGDVYRPKCDPSTSPLADDMKVHPLRYNKCVVRMLRSSHGWTPVKVVTSSTPSTYINALKVGSLIYDDIVQYVTNPQRALKRFASSNTIHTSIVQPVLRTMQRINRLIEQYVFEKYFNGSSMRSMIDIFDDDNIHVDMIYSIGNINSVYALHDNKSTLAHYVECATMKMSSPNMVTMLSGIRPRTSRSQFDISLIRADIFNDPTDYIVNKLNKQYTYMPHDVDVIYVHDRMGMIRSIMDVIRLRDLAKAVLSPNGVVIMKVMEQERLLEWIDGKQVTPVSAKSILRSKRGMVDMLNIKCIMMDSVKRSTSMCGREWCAQNGITVFDVKENGNVYVEVDVNGETMRFERSRYFDDVDVYEYAKACLIHRCDGAIAMDVDGVWKVRRNGLLDGIRKRNLRDVLGINVELMTNVFEYEYDVWYSDASVDGEFGSSGDVKEGMRVHEGSSEGVLMESRRLGENEMRWIWNRCEMSDAVTVIVTETGMLDGMGLPIERTLMMDMDGMTVAIMYGKRMRKMDMETLSRFAREALMCDGEWMLRYNHIVLKQNVYDNRVMWRSEFMDVFTDGFRMKSACQPMLQSEFVTFISPDKQFTNADACDGYMNACTVYVFERFE